MSKESSRGVITVKTVYAIKNVRDRKKELVGILLESVFYLDLNLAERNALLCLLLHYPVNQPVDGM